MRRDATICVLLIVATAAVYAQVLGHDFVLYDDPVYIYENEHVRNGPSLEGIRWAFTSASETGNWHPLTWMSHMLDCRLFGLNAGWHKLVNLLGHLANTVLLFLLLRRITGAFFPCAFVAAVFALHPLHVESVAWVSERKDVLSTLFWFLAIWAYVGYARRGGVARYAAVMVLFALGLMSKPMLVMLPCTLVLLDVWPLGRLRLGRQIDSPFPPASTRRVILEKLPLFAMAGALGIVTFLAQHTQAASTVEILPVRVRLVNAVISYGDYIFAMFLPRGLAYLYPHPWLLPSVGIPAWRWLVAAAVLVGISVAVARLRRRAYLVVGWLWYLIVLVPVIGLAQVGIQARADRYTYVPMIGLLIIIAWSVRDAVARWPALRRFAAAGAGAALAACAVLTWVQVGTWKDSISLFRHAAAVTRNNFTACTSLGCALQEAGRLDEAAAAYRRALAVKPDEINARGGLAAVLAEQGNFERAIEHFALLVAAKPGSGSARFQLALAHQRLAETRRTGGDARGERANLERAAAEYRRGLAFEPLNGPAHRNLGEVLLDLDDAEGALEHLRRAVELAPDDADAYLAMGHAFEILGRYDQAARQYRRVVELEPNLATGLNGLAWLLATAPAAEVRDGPEAVRCATLACQITSHRDAGCLDTLAAAHAEAGRFDRAILAIDRAIGLAREAGDDASAAVFAARKALYRARKPYHTARARRRGS